MKVHSTSQLTSFCFPATLLYVQHQHTLIMAENRQRMRNVLRRAWRARWQRVREGTPPPLVLKNTDYRRKLFWSQYPGSGFPPRVNHAVAAHQNEDGEWYVYSLGGYHADDDQRTVRQADSQGGPTFTSQPIDVHCCEIESRTWTHLTPPPEEQYFNVGPYSRSRVPKRRYGHTVCSYKGRVYMYGGRNDDDGSFANVDCYDIEHNIWLNVRQDGEKPLSRDGHACTSVGPEMFIHGGFSATELHFSPDTYAFNMSTHTWRKLHCNGVEVPERDFHAATATIGGKMMVVFGGRSDKFHPYFTANDEYDETFYSLDFDTNTWSTRAVTGYRPEGRRSHVAVTFGSSILYYGGYNAVHKQHFGDLFLLNTDDWHIQELRPFGDGPAPRRRVGCALVGTEMLVCGGTSPTKVTKDGKEMEILHDNDEMYILQLLPSLEQLCLEAVIKGGVSLDRLPVHMQRIIERIANRHIVTITPPSDEQLQP